MTASYHKTHFVHDPVMDSDPCPRVQRLTFRGYKTRTNRPVMRLYRGSGEVCRACPAFGIRTKDSRQGRALEVGEHDATLEAHRSWMQTGEAKQVAATRKSLIEPAFGVINEEMGWRRLHVRGQNDVLAEWTLFATACNLRICVRIWQHAPHRGR